LSERKAKLAQLLAGSTVAIVFNEHTDTEGAVVFRQACKIGQSAGAFTCGGLMRPSTSAKLTVAERESGHA
jgi:hypothetical protein